MTRPKANLADAEGQRCRFDLERAGHVREQPGATLIQPGPAFITQKPAYKQRNITWSQPELFCHRAEANAEKSEADLVRYSQLVAKEDISRQQYDQALASAKANRAAVDSLPQPWFKAMRRPFVRLRESSYRQMPICAVLNCPRTGFRRSIQGRRRQRPSRRAQGPAGSG